MAWGLTRPERLRPGDKVAVVSPSWGGPAVFPHRFEAGLAVMRQLGLCPVEMTHTRADPDWLRNTPAARAADLHDAFANPAIKGVWASIGGDDCLRLLPHLDLSVIARNPKVFIGFSDTTALHFACMKAGVAPFYGPAVMAGLAENAGPHDLTRAGLQLLFDPLPMGPMPQNTEGVATEFLDWADPALQARPRKMDPATPPLVLQGQGVAQGPLIGGCIEVLDMVNGTPWWPAPDRWGGAMVFIETSEENPDPDQVARSLRNMGAQGIWARAAGLLVARPESPDRDYAARLQAAICDELRHWGAAELPVLADLDIGHTQPMLTLPYGARCQLDADAVRWALLDGAVT